MAVVDPGFPQGGVLTPKAEVKSYYLANFPPKTAWNWNNLDPKGVHIPGNPLRSASRWGVSSHVDYKFTNFSIFALFLKKIEYIFTSIRKYNFSKNFCIVFSYNYVVKTTIIMKIVKYLCVYHMSRVEMQGVWPASVCSGPLATDVIVADNMILWRWLLLFTIEALCHESQVLKHQHWFFWNQFLKWFSLPLLCINLVFNVLLFFIQKNF